ncbi:MAG: hypothetical protein L3J54_07275 [Draconibacterium sp.]|nr:hypothetical protein [Draconibacterium sp.]
MNKTIKWILISATFIVLIVIIAGMYKFNYLANQPEYDCDGNKIEGTHQSEVLLKWVGLNTTNDLYVKIPDTNIECNISKIIDSDSLRYAKGT